MEKEGIIKRTKGRQMGMANWNLYKKAGQFKKETPRKWKSNKANNISKVDNTNLISGIRL